MMEDTGDSVGLGGAVESVGSLRGGGLVLDTTTTGSETWRKVKRER